jgi:MFS family permease
MALCAITLVSFVFLGVNGALLHVMINLIIIGIGFGLFSSPNTNAIMSCVPKEDYSTASSILATMRTLGQTVSMAIITIIMFTHLGDMTLNDASPEQLVSTMHTCYIVFSVICLVGVVISLQRKTKQLEKDKKF